MSMLVDRGDAIRAAVTAIGPAILREMPQVAEDPWAYIEDLREIAAALPRWQGTNGKLTTAEARAFCRGLVPRLEERRLPKGAGWLAILVQYASGALPRKSRRALWLRLAQNPRSFIRRRFMRLLRDGLTQREADVLWALHSELGDEASLWDLAMADAAVRLPAEVVEQVAELYGPPFLLSHSIAHVLHERGPAGFEGVRRKYPVASVYAIGYANRADFVPVLLAALRDQALSAEEHRAALWALARVGTQAEVLGVVGHALRTGV